MGDFLLIIPEGWTQLDWQYITNNIPSMDPATVLNAISSGMTFTLEEPLKTFGQIPAESTLVEAKLLDDNFFLVRLV